jgi:hypothetical protein
VRRSHRAPITEGDASSPGKCSIALKKTKSFPEPLIFQNFRPFIGYSFPVIDHQRSRQTIQMASRTMRFDILLSPSVRSTKTIGISTIRNPLRQARKLNSI